MAKKNLILICVSALALGSAAYFWLSGSSRSGPKIPTVAASDLESLDTQGTTGGAEVVERTGGRSIDSDLDRPTADDDLAQVEEEGDSQDQGVKRNRKPRRRPKRQTDNSDFEEDDLEEEEAPKANVTRRLE